MQIVVNYKDFISYQEKYKTTYIDKENKYQIWAPSKSNILNGFQEINEIFDGIKTEYDIQKSNDNYQISFKSKSENEYKFDLVKDPDENLYHLAFTLKSTTKDEYEKLTNLNESIEVFGKLSFILKEFSEKFGIDEFCIGATGNYKKDIIYQYMMRFVKSWEKRDTTHYKLGWGLYFKI